MQLLQEHNVHITLTDNQSEDFLLVCDASGVYDVTITLAGERANANIYGLFLGTESEVFDLTVTVHHAVGDTTSNILLIGALGGKAAASVKGKIHIAPGARGSVAREDIRTLLLSRDATVRAIPELAIENNDVKCSHAVSTTHIDTEKKFYLESRGVPEDEARAMVIEGHVAPILDRIDDERIRETILAKLHSV